MSNTMSQSTMCLDTELRKLRPAELYTLGQILNVSDSWKKIMAIVPKDDASNFPKFNSQHFSMIEQAAQQQRRNAAEIFLSEWGTMGKSRPTLRVLLNLLVKAELFRAADYLAGDILNEELPKRPECGPAAPVDISDEVIRKLLEENEENGSTDFNESLIFRLPSELDDNRTNNPNAINNAVNDSSLERNMQSTKLISSKGKQNEKHLENLNETLNAQISDSMKFGDEQNVDDCREQRQAVFEQQEMSSCELPVFLNTYKRTMEQTRLNQEVLSEEIPVFLNNGPIVSNKNLLNDQTNYSLQFSSSISQNELISAELPQCIIELRKNDESNSNNDNATGNERNITQESLTSQELPITILKYNG
ncbi:interleukin 1 receptor associated kinase 4 tube [Xylocopa sonorina]|uniref:interleukin 1 receptor associated kinase 4 tube n=1 Tax=Xylocopa sonorina TaxID=1818115 RepID=UPI00403A7F01